MKNNRKNRAKLNLSLKICLRKQHPFPVSQKLFQELFKIQVWAVWHKRKFVFG